MENIADAMSHGENRRDNSDDATSATETETPTVQRIFSATTDPSAATSVTSQPEKISSVITYLYAQIKVYIFEGDEVSLPQSCKTTLRP